MTNLEYIRKLKNISRKELSQELGISVSHYSRLVNSEDSRCASLNLIANACKILKCSPCVVLCDTRGLRNNLGMCHFCAISVNNLTLKQVYEAGINWEDFIFYVFFAMEKTRETERHEKLEKLKYIESKLGIN